MSCTVLALPYAIAYAIGCFAAGAVSLSNHYNKELGMDGLDFSENIENVNIAQPCDEVQVISDKHFIEKSFETAFMDKEILMKTLEEHGIRSISENLGQITGCIDNYSLTFEKMEADKPYFMRISCTETDNAEEKFVDLSNEYALNVQEESYMNIVDKLKQNNMEIEEEEVLDDNTIVLTVNLE